MNPQTEAAIARVAYVIVVTYSITFLALIATQFTLEYVL